MGFVFPLVASILALCVTTYKICLFIHRLREGKCYCAIETSLCFVLLIFSTLLLVFSVMRDETIIAIVLSLANGALVIYQWAWAWKLSVERWTERQRQSLVLSQVFCVAVVSILCVTLPKGREILHVLVFSFWAFEYIVLEAVYFYLYRHYQDHLKGLEGPRPVIVDLLWWNLWFGGICFVITILSVVFLATGTLDFISSLLLKMAAGVWFFRWLLLQAKPTFFKDRSENDKPEDLQFSTMLSSRTQYNTTGELSTLEEARFHTPAKPLPVHTQNHGLDQDSVIDSGHSTTSLSSACGHSITESELSCLKIGKAEHKVWKLALGGQLHLAKFESVQNVLDIGADQEHWAVDFANQYPAARVIGVNNSLVQSDEVQPTNLEFQLDNVQLDWTFEPSCFDYIHGRMLSRSIRDPGHLCREALRTLQPGGTLEIQDLAFTLQSKDNSSSGMPLQTWSRYMIEAGFTDVQMHCLLMEDGEFKEVDKLCLKILKDELHGVSLAAFTGWDKAHAEVERSLVNVRNAIQDPKIHAIFAIHGSKPW